MNAASLPSANSGRAHAGQILLECGQQSNDQRRGRGRRGYARPLDKLNALDPAMFGAIIAAGERLGRMSGLGAVVLTGAGKGFCAGLDR
jgi:hypothetical protein